MSPLAIFRLHHDGLTINVSGSDQEVTDDVSIDHVVMDR